MKIQKYMGVLTEDKLCTLVKDGSAADAEGDSLYSPRVIADVFQSVIPLNMRSEECVWLVCMDTKLHPVGVIEVAHGSASCSFAPVREIMQKALLLNAVKIAVVHNHPSGDVTPSKADVTFTSRLFEAGKLLEVPLVDSVIVGGNTREYYSFQERTEILE